MLSRNGHRVRLGALSLVVAAAAANTGAQSPDALARLKREGQITCQPAHPYFCANLHVTCLGRTTLPTFSFTLRISASGPALDAPKEAQAFAELYAGSQLDWSPDGLYLIISPVHAAGYIKLFQDGKYVFRYYPQHEGVMSLGSCG
jgi:hypothetical protein